MQAIRLNLEMRKNNKFYIGQNGIQYEMLMVDTQKHNEIVFDNKLKFWLYHTKASQNQNSI